jgi:adenine-specific DNA methylase
LTSHIILIIYIFLPNKKKINRERQKKRKARGQRVKNCPIFEKYSVEKSPRKKFGEKGQELTL